MKVPQRFTCPRSFFLFSQRPAGPSVSTAPVHPPDCFMVHPNRLINHRGWSLRLQRHSDLAQNDGNMQRLLVIVELHNRTIVGSFSSCFHFSLWWDCRVLASCFFARLSLILIILFLTIISWSTHFYPCTEYESRPPPPPHPFFPAHQGLIDAQMMKTRDCRRAI